MKAMILVAAMLAPAGASIPVGTWRQASDATERVLESRVKLTPGGSWGGTSLGGSVGYGSMTTTRVVVEPTPRRVARAMTLTIGGDGGFDWTTERRFADAEGCARTVRRHRTGRVAAVAGTLVFAVRGGEETTAGCGRDARTAVAAGEERYTVTTAPGTMTLAGAGGVRWQFRR